MMRSTAFFFFLVFRLARWFLIFFSFLFVSPFLSFVSFQITCALVKDIRGGEDRHVLPFFDVGQRRRAFRMHHDWRRRPQRRRRRGRGARGDFG